MLTATGASLSIIGRSLGHKSVATTAIYAKLDLDPVRASVNTAADAILAADNGPKAVPAPPGAGDGQALPAKPKRVKANASLDGRIDGRGE